MRVLLINSNRFHQPWPVIPFGLCCVAAAVEAAGHEVRVLDLCFSRSPARDIEGALAAFGPDVVGVSIRNLDNGVGCEPRFLLEEVRDQVTTPLARAFAGPIVIGGPAVGINASEMLEFLGLEYAIRGDGEAALVELLRRLSARDPLAGLAGLVHRTGGRIVENNQPWKVADLDALPPARVWRWLDLAPYTRAGASLPIQTKRGCALTCTYCTYNRIEGRAWRLRDPRLVADEIAEAVRESGIRVVEFTDSTFNLPLEHTKAVLREVASRHLDVQLRTMGLNPGAVDEELADLLVAARFRDVDLGVESGCDATLRGLGKSFTREAVLRSGRLLRARGIAVTWYLLLGGPNESAATLAETFATLREAAGRWDLINVGVGLRVYAGAPIAERLRREGDPAAQGGFLRPVAYHPRTISLDEVKTLTKREALKRTNYFLYGEDERTPLFVMILGTWLLRLLAPRAPIWRLFIVMRLVQRWLLITALRWLVFAVTHRRELRGASRAQRPTRELERSPVSS